MLQDAGLPRCFWAEAVSTANYCLNRAPTSALKFQIPLQVWSRKKISVKHLRVFGCDAYALDPHAKKMEAKAKKFKFVGYLDTTKGYRLYDMDKNAVFLRRDVVFNEDLTEEPDQKMTECCDETVSIEEPEEPCESNTDQVEETQPRRTGRVRHPPIRYGFEEYAEVCHYAMTIKDAPATFEEAMS